MTILCVGTHLALMAVLETNMPLLLNIEHDNDRMASGKPCTRIYARVMSLSDWHVRARTGERYEESDKVDRCHRRRNSRRRMGMSVAALASDAPSAGVSATSAKANATPQSADGHYLFRTYCASCHGTSAIGDGPLAASMRRPPANLAEIAKRNDGVYDSELVYRVIDGRQRVRGHGGPDMPVWGDAFFRTIDGGSEETDRLKIQALVSYLKSIQARQGF